MTHAVTWHTAQPLWNLSLEDNGSSPARFREPALLRFAGDDYMQQLDRALKQAPASLAPYVARPETWDDERVGWRAENEAPDARDLRLFQPAHFRFYFVAAALVCQMPGLPERTINAAQRERCSFVMRRLFPRAGVTFDENDSGTYEEFAWVGTPQHGSWRPVTNPSLPLADEERLPLSPKSFGFESGKRTLLIGLIPVARRDIYQAGVGDIATPVPARLLKADSFSSEAAATAFQKIDKALEELSIDPIPIPADFDIEKKISLAHALLDLADFIAAQLPAVSDALSSGSSAGLPSAQSTVLTRLMQSVSNTSRHLNEILLAVSQPGVRGAIESGTVTPADVDQLLGVNLNTSQLGVVASSIRGGNAAALRESLVAAIDARIDDYSKSVTSTWGDLSRTGLTDKDAQDSLLGLLLRLSEFLSSELPDAWNALASGATGALPVSSQSLVTSLRQTLLGDAAWSALLLDSDARRKEILANHITPEVLVVARRLAASQIAASLPYAATLDTLVRAALRDLPLPSKSDAKAALQASPPDEPDPNAWYRTRCVYERPQCVPIHDPVMSDPSLPFQLAGFFDPGAPIRPIRIQMPEASLDQLKRGAKGLGIATSKELRKQVDRARNAGLKDLTDKKVGAGTEFEFGLICQLSIPIITIVAFILIMIVVQLLNLIFHWIPYFILCLPRIGKKS